LDEGADELGIVDVVNGVGGGERPEIEAAIASFDQRFLDFGL
jgi:hypothetical protein